jgi:uncharacterized protein YjdB
MIHFSIAPRVLCMVVAAALLGCSAPSKLEAVPDRVVLNGLGQAKKIEVKVYDDNGDPITEDLKFVWFSTDTKIIKLDQDGTVKGIASGEAKVEIEVIGTDLKATVPIRVKNPASIKVSHEKLRLWTGQVKNDVWAEVHSEKDAFVEGYLPTWSSDDPAVVQVEAIDDPRRRQSWVKLTALKSGTTTINAVFKNITKTVRVSVFDEDEETELDGTRIPKKKK